MEVLDNQDLGANMAGNKNISGWAIIEENRGKTSRKCRNVIFEGSTGYKMSFVALSHMKKEKNKLTNMFI